MAVRVAHRGQHALKQPDPCLDAELQPIAIRIDRLALDVLEHEVRLRLVDDPGVDEARDIGMIQPAEHSPLAAEALFPGSAEPVCVEKFDRDRTLESSVGPARSPDAAHTAPTDLGFDDVGADSAPDEGRAGCGQCAIGQELGISFAPARCERTLNLGRDTGMRGRELSKPRNTLRLGQLERAAEVFAERMPLLLRQISHRAPPSSAGL